MGLLGKSSRGRTYCMESGTEDPSCFYCSFEIHGAGVYWSGRVHDNSVHIHLHHSCAQKFLVRLARDIWQVEKDNRDWLVHKN